MEELGSRLRTAREKSGISLTELSGRTKIRESFLAAMEKGEFSALPGPVYTKAFLRLYAREVGLDAESLLARYIGASEEKTVVTKAVHTDPESIKDRPERGYWWFRLRPRIWQWAFVAALAVTFLVGRWYSQYLKRNEEATPRLDVEAPKPVAPEAPPNALTDDLPPTSDVAPSGSSPNHGNVEEGISGGQEQGASTNPGTNASVNSSANPTVNSPVKSVRPSASGSATPLSAGSDSNTAPVPVELRPSTVSLPAEPQSTTSSIDVADTSGAQATDTAPSDDLTVIYPGRSNANTQSDAQAASLGGAPGI